MKTKLKAIIFVIFMLAVICISSKVQAASASISASKTTATVGDSVTITVSINAAAWNLKVNGTGVSGGNIVGYDPEGVNTSTSKTYSLNTSSTGTYTIYLNGDVTDGSTDVNSSISKSVTVTVNPKPTPPPTNTGGSTTGGSSSGGSSGSSGNSGSSSSSGNSSSGKPSTGTTTTKPEEKKSNDSTLKGLVVEGYELYPVFETNTREYNLRVTNDITKVTVVPTVNNEKASYKIEGATEELLVGKNVITVVVTAEDGSSSNYLINVIRNREGLNVENIKIFYTDETGNKQELVLNPAFSSEVFEYTVNNLSYLIDKLDAQVLANFEEAKIEITGNENLVEGENIITITVTMLSESEEEADEVLTYTIKVNKDAEPVITLMGRIENWFNGITGTVSTWFNENVHEILTGSLIVCSFALGGLSVYLVTAYKKYKLMVQKIAELTKINNAETIKTTENIAKEQSLEIEPDKQKGRHF